MADLGLLDGRLTITAETPISQVPGSPLQAATSLAFPGCANTGSVVVVSAITPDSGGESDLWLVQVATPAVPVRLTNTASYSERWATFSPDDRLLCFHRDMKGVLVMTLDGGGTTVLDRKGVRPNHRRL